MIRNSPTDSKVVKGLLCVALVALGACGGERAGHSEGGGAIVDGEAETGPLDLWYGGPETGSAPDAIGANVVAPLECDGGYFIEVTDDAGTRSFRSSCVGSDAAIQTTCKFCAEDYFSAILEACSGASGIVVEVADPQICVAGGSSKRAFVSYDDGDGGIISGLGGVTFAREPTWFRGCLASNGGPTVGEFGAYVGGADAAAGAAGMKAVSGRFCLSPLGTL
jgi:hypothetical protein